jgi:hypothetical protein
MKLKETPVDLATQAGNKYYDTSLYFHHLGSCTHILQANKKDPDSDQHEKRHGDRTRG